MGDVDQATKSQMEHVLASVSNTIRTALDLLDAQPAAVLDLMVEHTRAKRRAGKAPKHRRKFQATFIEYLEERQVEAEARERRLEQAITGKLPDA